MINKWGFLSSTSHPDSTLDQKEVFFEEANADTILDACRL